MPIRAAELKAAAQAAARKAVEETVEAVAANSQQLVPRDTGALAESMTVTVKDLTGKVEYNMWYAAEVHERGIPFLAHPMLSDGRLAQRVVEAFRDST